MARIIVAIVAGVIVAVVVVFAVESLGHAIFPPPETIDFNDPEQLSGLVASIPIEALLFVPLAWFLGSFSGGVLAVMIAREQALLLASIVAAFILAGAVATLMAIPHPLWLVITGIGSIILSTIVATKIGVRLLAGNTSDE